MTTTSRSYFDVTEEVVLANGDVFRTYRAGSVGPHVILLHGGGYASTTWCLVAEALKANVIVHAIDLRGHGSTHTANESNLSIGTLVEDIIQVLAQILPQDDPELQSVLVGHSLGGAVAVRVAASERLPSLVGVMVVDVVEGTAIASLEHMDRILAKRPKCFKSIEEAVQWTLHTGMVRNADAAALSIPSQLSKSSSGQWNWRTDLKRSAPYWRDWFVGLSEQFLSLKVAKILVLAGSDRLDTTLMRGQMMGKFELRVVYGAGHVIQEDCPDQVANAIMEFCGRCARMLTVNRCGLEGFNPAAPAKMPTSGNELLAVRLAKARAMTPNLGTGLMPPKPPQ